MADEQADYLKPGELFGEFTVLRRLGKGGMGVVYLAEHPEAGLFAVKIVDPSKASHDQEFVKRFAREGNFAMKTRHPNLIPVHDVGQDPDTGYYYLVMDYVSGGDVGQRLQREGRFSVADAVRIVAMVASALQGAHELGVVHRDLKPENILFDAGGTPKLADLGVAKFSDGAQMTMLTSASVMIGTPAYMAPEQIMDAHGVDARADVYALGIVLFEMLTGQRPNEGLSVLEIVARAVRGEPIPDVRTVRPDVPAAVAQLLGRMCAPRREDRMSAEQVVSVFSRLAANVAGGQVVPPVAPVERAAPAPTPASGIPTPNMVQKLNHVPTLRIRVADRPVGPSVVPISQPPAAEAPGPDVAVPSAEVAPAAPSDGEGVPGLSPRAVWRTCAALLAGLFLVCAGFGAGHLLSRTRVARRTAQAERAARTLEAEAAELRRQLEAREDGTGTAGELQDRVDAAEREHGRLQSRIDVLQGTLGAAGTYVGAIAKWKKEDLSLLSKPSRDRLAEWLRRRVGMRGEWQEARDGLERASQRRKELEKLKKERTGLVNRLQKLLDDHYEAGFKGLDPRGRPGGER